MWKRWKMMTGKWWRRRGTSFVVNGQPFYVNGFNTYWLMVFAADQSTRGKVSELFQQSSSVGLTVCRTWAFNDGQSRALQKSPTVYDEGVFKAHIVFASLVNNWDAYGGKAQYVKWGKAAGLNLTSDDEFFSHPTLRSYYRPTLSYHNYILRPDCHYLLVMDSRNGSVVEEPKHLVEIGLEGFYGPSAPARAQFNPNSYATQVELTF
ncbi:hypothetical protein CRYUN_Cryun29cG0002900 [Craigia yunnanensis]